MSASPNSNIDEEDGVVGYRLDPADWDEYRSQMHQLFDECCDRMKSYRELPWQPPPSNMQQGIQLGMVGDRDTATTTAARSGEGDHVTRAGRPLRDVMDELVNDIMPYATGNTHPKFMGWVHGAGLPSSTVRVNLQDQYFHRYPRHCTHMSHTTANLIDRQY